MSDDGVVRGVNDAGGVVRGVNDGGIRPGLNFVSQQQQPKRVLQQRTGESLEGTVKGVDLMKKTCLFGIVLFTLNSMAHKITVLFYSILRILSSKIFCHSRSFFIAH